MSHHQEVCSVLLPSALTTPTVKSISPLSVQSPCKLGGLFILWQTPSLTSSFRWPKSFSLSYLHNQYYLCQSCLPHIFYPLHSVTFTLSTLSVTRIICTTRFFLLLALFIPPVSFCYSHLLLSLSASLSLTSLE